MSSGVMNILNGDFRKRFFNEEENTKTVTVIDWEHFKIRNTDGVVPSCWRIRTSNSSKTAGRLEYPGHGSEIRTQGLHQFVFFKVTRHLENTREKTFSGEKI